MNEELLHGHLRNHWFAACLGTAAFDRVARTHGLPDIAAEVGDLAVEIRQDRDSLGQIMTDLGIGPGKIGGAAAQVGERIGRVRPTGRLLGRSELLDVLELEALRSAVEGKRVGWEMLRTAADAGAHIDPAQIDLLLHRADRQLERLKVLHEQTARRHLRE